MEIVNCVDEPDLKKYNIQHGKCINDYIKRVFGTMLATRKIRLKERYVAA